MSDVWNEAGRRIRMHEVGPRDGLQMEAAFVPSADKIALVDALSAAGLAKIEVTAFVSSRAIPALRDAEIVLREIARRPGVTYAALVPNLRGAERAVEARADELNLVMSASESHNLANLRMSRAQSLHALVDVARLAATRASPSTCRCRVHSAARSRATSRPTKCCKRPTIHGRDRQPGSDAVRHDGDGVSGPGRRADHGRAPPLADCELTLHFHNTRGMGLANLMAAIDAGAHRFDASLGGIGGCPYAPGASGNVCTEEVVHALECMGYDTGVSLPLLIEAARRLPALIGHDVPSQIVKAGRRLDVAIR